MSVSIRCVAGERTAIPDDGRLRDVEQRESDEAVRSSDLPSSKITMRPQSPARAATRHTYRFSSPSWRIRWRRTRARMCLARPERFLLLPTSSTFIRDWKVLPRRTRKAEPVWRGSRECNNLTIATGRSNVGVRAAGRTEETHRAATESVPLRGARWLGAARRATGQTGAG